MVPRSGPIPDTQAIGLIDIPEQTAWNILDKMSQLFLNFLPLTSAFL